MKRVLVVIAATAVIAFAGDPEKAKNASDWTEKETKRILTNSPWAKSADVEMNLIMAGGPGGAGGGIGRPSGGMGEPANGPGGPSGMSGPGGGSGGPVGGIGGPGGGIGAPTGMALPKITIRWESAEPVREASSRAESQTRDQFSEWSKEYYVLSLFGMSPMRAGGQNPVDARGPDSRKGSQVNSERMQRMIQATTTLRRKGKEALVPWRVEMITTGDTAITVFLFPRAGDISLEDKEVTFQTTLGPMKVRSKFKLKDMQYLGKLAL